MSEINTAVATIAVAPAPQTPSATPATNPAATPVDPWAALDKMGSATQTVTPTPPATPAKPTTPTPDGDKPAPADDPANSATPKPDDPATTPADEPLIIFKAEDVAGVKKDYEDGTWAAVLAAKGYDVPADFSEDNGIDVFVDQVTAPLKQQIEEAKLLSFDRMVSTLKPETATALKLLEMGLNEEHLIAPTREIQEYLKLDDNSLIRQNLEWDLRDSKDASGNSNTDTLVDHEMEKFIADPNKLRNEAAIIRNGLKGQEQNILQQRTQLVQQFEQRKQDAALAQKQQEIVQFKTALDTVSTFMGYPVPNEVKEAIFKSYSSGEQANNLDTPKNRAEYAVYQALGQKVVSHLKNTAFQKGKDQVNTKLANIPPVLSGGQRSITNPNISTGESQWDKYERAISGS